jgi:hypothetical protein
MLVPVSIHVSDGGPMIEGPCDPNQIASSRWVCSDDVVWVLERQIPGIQANRYWDRSSIRISIGLSFPIEQRRRWRSGLCPHQRQSQNDRIASAFILPISRPSRAEGPRVEGESGFAPNAVTEESLAYMTITAAGEIRLISSSMFPHG